MTCLRRSWCCSANQLARFMAQLGEHLQNEDPDLQKYFFCNSKKYFFLQIRDILFSKHDKSWPTSWAALWRNLINWQLQKRNKETKNPFFPNQRNTFCKNDQQLRISWAVLLGAAGWSEIGFQHFLKGGHTRQSFAKPFFKFREIL